MHVEADQSMSSAHPLLRVPEGALVVWGALLHGAWEALHSPLYADHGRAWSYLLWTRLHCTIGDVLILLATFWLTALVFRTRRWYRLKPLAGTAVFTLLGVGYTVFSEWLHTKVLGSWAYGPGMPTVLGVGLSPLLQWVILPPTLVWLLRRIEA